MAGVKILGSMNSPRSTAQLIMPCEEMCRIDVWEFRLTEGAPEASTQSDYY